MARDGSRWLRRAWFAFGSFACLGVLGSSTFAMVHERRAVPEISGREWGEVATARMPIAPVPIVLGADDWRPVSRFELASGGWIDITSCEELVEYPALSGIPHVLDAYESVTNDGFMSVRHLDYGDADAADERLEPMRRPGFACRPDRLGGVERSSIELPPLPSVNATARRNGSLAVVVVSGADGRAIIAHASRASDDQIVGLATRAAATLTE